MNIYATSDEQNLTTDEEQLIEQAPKRVHIPSLVLAIIGLVFALLLPIVTYPCSIIALVQSRKKKQEFKTTAAFVMSIIGLVIAIINSTIGAVLNVLGIHPFL